jgi:signal transduction histidine kinase
MWAFLILVWRMLTKVLRRTGRWALLAPVSMVGAALFGLNTWTAAAVLCALLFAVLLALILLGRRSAGSSGLLPVAMLGAGLCGLWAAVTTAGTWAKGASISVLFGAGIQKPAPASFPRLIPRSAPVTTPAGALPAHAAFTGLPGGEQVFMPPWWTVSMKVASARAHVLQNKATALYQAKLNAVARNVVARNPGRPPKLPPGPRRIPDPGGVSTVVSIPGHTLLWGRLLILGSLLLLALGLWLAPRAVSDLRDQWAKVAPHLKRWGQEGNWGVLLVPVTSFGLTIFGVRPWTVAAIIAAVIITIRWPKLAADLVPAILVGFALCGFIVASRWIPGSLGTTRVAVRGAGAFLGPLPTPAPQITWFGAVPVDSLPTSLLAGVEASVLLAFGAWLFPRTIGAHVHGRTPGQTAELAGRVQRLTETRTQAVDAAAAELRRIERDLHDGTQARLVALGMNLRALERMLPPSSSAELALVAEARDTSLRALNDLRHLVRGIYPPVLADRGLAHAVHALALDAPIPVEVDVDLPGRLSPPVESACYFAVAEILANAVKHSGAHRVHIRMQHRDGVLRIEVADDGTGGADPGAGTGLRGVERRLGTFDGILAVSSPVGGPTMIAMEVPCALSSQKTYSS